MVRQRRTRLTELSATAVCILLFQCSYWPHLAWLGWGRGSGETRLVYDPDTGTLTSLKATVYDCIYQYSTLPLGLPGPDT